jgi:hypothetical protein
MSVHVVFNSRRGFTTKRIKVLSATTRIDVDCHPVLSRLVDPIETFVEREFCGNARYVGKRSGDLMSNTVYDATGFPYISLFLFGAVLTYM